MRFLTIVNGVKTLVSAITSTNGVNDANKVISTNSSGKIDATFLSNITYNTIYFEDATDGYSFNTTNSLYLQDEADGYTFKVIT
jgi:hypothetical protein